MRNELDEQFKPVVLDADKCNGCVACMKRCPTEAIRVRNGKAAINYARCIGCGECVKICPVNAKKENYDTLASMQDYEYTVCLPSPSLYGQFNNLTDVNYVLTGLKKLGFDKIVEVGYGAEFVSNATKQYLGNKNVVRPVIGSACSAVTELILMRYAHLIPHLSPMKQPETVAAKIAVTEALKETGLKREKIGIFVITQCAAKVSELKQMPAAKYIDKVLSVKDIYFDLLGEMNKLTSADIQKLSRCGKLGISWSSTTGEAAGLGTDNYLSADGMENVIDVLSELEHGKLGDLEFLELYGCPSGCVGGSMNIENPFLARTRLRQIRNKTPETVIKPVIAAEYMRADPYPIKDGVFRLSETRADALKLTKRLNEIYDKLPGLDCGACGAPNCRALAEDIAKGAKARCKYVQNDNYEE